MIISCQKYITVFIQMRIYSFQSRNSIIPSFGL